jgi:hypothetical protein
MVQSNDARSLEDFPHQNIRLLILPKHKWVAAKLLKTFAFIKADGFVVMFPNAEPYVAQFLAYGGIYREINKMFAYLLPLVLLEYVYTFYLQSVRVLQFGLGGVVV